MLPDITWCSLSLSLANVVSRFVRNHRPLINLGLDFRRRKGKVKRGEHALLPLFACGVD